RYGRGFYPYAFFGSRYWGYPYWGYGSSWPYGYSSSWYPYSSWNLYDGGYGYGYPDYGYSDYGIAPDSYGDTYDNYGVYPPADNGYGTAPSYAEESTSRITITAPPGANIWVEGVKIASVSDGAVHTFQTPPLNPDQQYRYRVRAVWTASD